MSAASIEQTLDAAIAAHGEGRLFEAESSYQWILSQEPENAVALHHLGLVIHQQQRTEEGIALIRKAISMRPDLPNFRLNLYKILTTQGRGEAALDELRAWGQQCPEDSAPFVELGRAFESRHRKPEAAEAYRAATDRRPDDFEAWANLGAVLSSMKDNDGAFKAVARSLELNNSCAVAWYTMGTLLLEQGRPADAIAAYRSALANDPSMHVAYSNILYAMNFDPRCTPREAYHEHWVYNAVYARPLERAAASHQNDRSPNRPLRVGYVSPDFRSHSISLFMYPLIARHDRRQVQVYCYSDVVRPDLMTDYVRGKSDAWREIHALDDDAAARLIREDRIDILVDLALHTSQGRPLLFARRPAPVQACWLGYPGTTGLTVMDYRLSDAILDPPGQNDAFYFEQTARLPGSMWAYEPVEPVDDPVAPPSTKSGQITFGCLNTFSKVNDYVIDMWAGVLRAVPGSRMFLTAQGSACERHFLNEMSARGVVKSRFVFVERQSWLDYMDVYNRIDIVLDTFPWNGHTMSLDALWMGVPVISLCGQTAVSRAGLSYLTNVGLGMLVARSPLQYVQIAERLAADRPRLSAIRAGLRPQMAKSPLCQTDAFARNMEAAYRQMWHRWTQTIRF